MPSLKKILTALIPLILLSVLTIFLIKGFKSNSDNTASPFLGKAFPEFSGNSLEHAEVQLTNQLFRGHASLVNVFTSWCSDCQVEHDMLMNIKSLHHIAIYGLDYKDKRQSAIEWLKKYGDPYTRVIFDPQGKLATSLGVRAAPETFVVDKEGVIRYKLVGPISAKQWKKKMLPLMLRLEREKT